MKSNILLETERLILREATPDDLELMVPLNADPLVMRYIGNGSVFTREQSLARLKRMRRIYEIYPGLGMWIGEEKPTRRFVGTYALIYIPNTAEVEVGYRLHQHAWGRGLATEGSRALVRYGMFELGINRIVGLTHPENQFRRFAPDATRQIQALARITGDRGGQRHFRMHGCGRAFPF